MDVKSLHYKVNAAIESAGRLSRSLGANKVCIDKIMGHKSNDVGERIYTHKVIQELKEAIELIKD